MALLQKALLRIPRSSLIPLHKYSVSSWENDNALHFKSDFTQEEQIKILTTLNNSNADQLSRFEVSQNRIKNIESWKTKKGPFRSLNEVLEVDGLGEKLLHKICENIVQDRCSIEQVSYKNSTVTVKNKRNKQLVSPPINGTILNNITSAVGIHISPIGISWAKIIKESNKLVSWNFEDFSSLPKKMLPDDTFHQSINIVRKLPPSDVYIFETNSSLGPQGNVQSSAVAAYTQQLELTAMLLSLLNTSATHNVTLQNVNEDSLSKPVENRVFYLKSRTPARLFDTLVGQEKVAALTIVKELIDSELSDKKLTLPCTPITVENQLKSSFFSQSSANKELLGQALMLIISFMDLCLYKNPAAVYAISRNRNKTVRK